MCKKSLMAALVVLWTIPAFGEIVVDTGWVRRYSSPGQGTDRAYGLAVDASGKVYVTGSSQVVPG